MTEFCYNTLMSRQDPHTAFVPPANTYPIHSPEWVYDEIMRHIEPELMLAELPLLENRYAGESEAQKTRRLAGYERAFQVFDAAYGKVVELLSEETHQLRARAREQVGKQERDEASKDMADFESRFDATNA